MDRTAIYAALRKRDSGVFGTSLSQPQVDGVEAILNSCQRHGISNIHHAANILAQVYHETGRYMSPIKETVQSWHKDKNPSDATVIARLNTAWAKGQLSWVKTPYWRDGWFGRGPIQTTHERNYRKMGAALGVDLIKHPERLLEHTLGADSAVVGMSKGLYTGKKLSDYSFPACLNAAPKNHPRRIVNGTDGTDGDISDYHRAFAAALKAGGYTGAQDAPQTPSPAPKAPETPSTQPTGRRIGVAGWAAAVGLAVAALAGAGQWIADFFTKLMGL